MSSQPSAESAVSILIRSAQQAKANLVGRLESGTRDYPQMRADLEQYTESLSAADHLREHFKPRNNAQ